MHMDLILLNLGIRLLLFKTLEFRPSRLKYEFDLFVSNIKIGTLSFQTLEFVPYPFEPWKSHLTH